MKIRLTQRKGSVGMRITAQSDNEAVDLKDMVMSLGTPTDTLGAVKVAEFLASRNYRGARTKQTAKTQEFTVSSAPPDPTEGTER